jgi:phosphate transport system substrate-binding protein
MRRNLLAAITLITFLLAGCAQPAPGTTADSTPSSSVYIQNKGSDTIVNLALAWAERYQTDHPDVRISVTGGGSGTGITALIDGTVDIANASRAMKKEEIAAAEQKGIEPVEHVIARDAIAVIVNPNNPVNQLTLQQISMIYRGVINNWSEVGGEDRPIVRLSRESNSGTHVYFLETVIRLGSKTDKSIFSADTLLLPSSEGIISEVRDNPNAIGYDGLGYVIPEVKVLAVAKSDSQPYVMPSVVSVNNGEYPVSRDLYMYAAKNISQPVVDYLAWILSPEAQQIVVNLGFVPVKK